MGWKEGEGLGKNEDGMKSCIQITRREEGTGLGNENTTPAATFKWNDSFWTDMYNQNASKFTGIKGEGASLINGNSSSSSSSSSESSDDEPAKKKKAAIKKKVETASSDSDSDISEIEIVKAEKSYFVAVKEASKSIKKDKDSKKDKKKDKKKKDKKEKK